MADTSITNIWTAKRFKGPEPVNVRRRYAPIMQAFADNGVIVNSMTNYRGVEVSTPEDLENGEWWNFSYNPPVEGDFKSSWQPQGDAHRPADVGAFVSRGIYIPKFIDMRIGVDYDDRAWKREEEVLRMNMWDVFQQEIIGDHSATNTGDGLNVSTILDSPGTNNDSASRPALLPSDADGGDTGCLTDGSSIKLGASGTITTLINTIYAVFSAVGIDAVSDRVALFVPPAGYAALMNLQAETGISDRSLGRLQGAFKGGVYNTEWFHSRTDSDASSATDFDLVAIDMDLVKMAVMGGDIRTVSPKTYYSDMSVGKRGYHAEYDLAGGIQFTPVYDGTTYYKGVAVITGCTSAA